MKKQLSSLIFSLFCFAAVAQTPTSAPTQPTSINWHVGGTGHAATLGTALASQWATANTAASVSADEVAFVAAEQAKVTACLAASTSPSADAYVVTVTRRAQIAVDGSTDNASISYTCKKLVGFIN